MAKYLLDTNICIYIQKHKPLEVLNKFKALSVGDAVISQITWGELVYGAYKSQYTEKVLKELEQLVRLIPVLALTDLAAEHYGQIRAQLTQQGQLIGANDLWIAAHARASQLVLVSNNIKVFTRVEGLKLENWVNN
ncbi:type II toxin-antitoxin system tRNA(fMet)-specific endonuclease VapC [Acinetobacter populi]|uniref:Ribonuclease VapC n=1 Tax=Acinetobacter populi TaxID=1582270 RepID=A0A1Z9Z3T6_9GAMM|nr:type II toxin-antitoxin system VapC family toxin [Acinetobacter populi]OUY09115.1 VapC toxin family PIN domain ribonuclease [Acinetobacter populi]